MERVTLDRMCHTRPILSAIVLLAASGLLVFLLVVVLPEYHLVGLVFLSAAGVIVGLLAVREAGIAQPLIFGFAGRIALVFIHFFLFALPGSAKDAVSFEKYGWERAQDGFMATFSYLKIGSGVYYWFVSAVYSVVGRSPMTIVAVNVLLGTLIVWNAYRTARLLWGNRAAVVAAWWIALLPNLVLNSVLILREAFVAYFFSLAIYHFVRWIKSGRSISVILSMALVGLAASFHEGVFIAIPIIAIVAIWRSFMMSFAKSRSAPIKPLFLVVVILTAVGIGFTSGWGQFFTQAYFERADVHDLEFRQEISARSRATYPSSLTVNGPVDIIVKGPVRMMYFLFAPFPWMARDVVDLLGILDSLLYAYFIYLMWRMRHVIRKDYSAITLVFVFIAILAVFGLAVGNYGTAIRHRAKIVVIPIVLVAGYGEYRRKSRSRRSFVENRPPESSSKMSI